MTATALLISSKRGVSNYEITLTADADEVILDVQGAKNICIESDGISADEVMVYESVFDDESKITNQVLNNGVNPFITDSLEQIKNANITKIKFIRVGGSDGDIKISVNFQS